LRYDYIPIVNFSLTKFQLGSGEYYENEKKSNSFGNINSTFFNYTWNCWSLGKTKKKSTDFECNGISWLVNPPGKAWEPDGRLHFRGYPHYTTISGDFNGKLYFMGNNNLDGATFDETG
jgi:hypothetical protein